MFAPAIALLVELNKGNSPLASFTSLHWRRYLSPLLDPLAAVIDHCVALADGGTHDVANFVAACNKCNALKSVQKTQVFQEAMARRKVEGQDDEPTDADGFTGLFWALADADPKKLSPVDRAWYTALSKERKSPTPLPPSACR